MNKNYLKFVVDTALLTKSNKISTLEAKATLRAKLF